MNPPVKTEHPAPYTAIHSFTNLETDESNGTLEVPLVRHPIPPVPSTILLDNFLIGKIGDPVLLKKFLDETPQARPETVREQASRFNRFWMDLRMNEGKPKVGARLPEHEEERLESKHRNAWRKNQRAFVPEMSIAEAKARAANDAWDKSHIETRSDPVVPPFKPEEVATFVAKTLDGSPSEVDHEPPLNLDNMGGRRVKPVWVKFRFPKLDFIGFWNDTPLGSGPLPFATHFGAHLDKGDFIEVEMPESLPFELALLWITPSRDTTFSVYLATEVRARNLMRTVDASAESIYRAILYGCAISYLASYYEQQNVNRVVKQAYWRWWRLKVGLFSIVQGCFWTTLGVLTHSWIPMIPSLVVSAVIFGALRTPDLRIGPQTDWKRFRQLGPDLKAQPNKGILSEDVANKFLKEKSWDSLVQGREVRIVGIVNPRYPPFCFMNHPRNERNAIVKRLMTQVEKPDEVYCFAFCQFVKKMARKILGPSTQVQPKDFSVWLKNTNSSNGMKVKLQKAKDECVARGISEDQRVSPWEAARWCWSDIFGKDEKHLIEIDGVVADKAQRVVCAAQPNYTIHTGPYDVAVMGYLKRHIFGPVKVKVQHRIYFSTTLTNVECANIITQGLPYRRIVKGDFGKFDGSQHQFITPVRHVMDDHFRAPPLVKQLRKAADNFKGRSVFGYIVKMVEGIMASGKTDTTKSNTFLNLCANLFAIWVSTRLDIDVILREVIMLVCGDDILMSVPSYYSIIDFKAALAPLGLEADHYYCPDLSDVEFCSMLLVPCEGGYTFTPKVGNILMKIGFSISNVSDSDLPGTFKGTILSLYEQCYVIEATRYFLDANLRILGDVQPIMPQHPEWSMVQFKRANPTPATAAYMWERYGVGPTFVRAWQELLLTVRTKGPLLSRLYDVFCDRDVTGKKLYFDIELQDDPHVTCHQAIVQTHPTWFSSENVREEEQKGHNSEMYASQGNDSKPVDFRKFLLDNAPTLRLPVYPTDKELEDYVQVHVDQNFSDINGTYLTSYLWFLASAVTNALQHAYNGNPKKGKKKEKVTIIEQTSSKSHKNKNNHSSSSSVPTGRIMKGRGDYTWATGAANIGGVLGSGLDTIWKRITGKGAYKVRQNALMSNTPSGPVPKFDASDGFTYSHSERFAAVFGTSNFTQAIYPLNATNAQLFPFIVQLAAGFEELEVMGFLVYYKTTSGSVTTSQGLGAVYFGANYDPRDQGFPNSTSMLASEFSTETVPSCDCIFFIECARDRNVLTRLYSPLDANEYGAVTPITGASSFSTPNSPSDRFTTHCNIVVATQGNPTTNQLGELFVSAKLRFSKPRLLNCTQLSLSGTQSFASMVPNVGFGSMTTNNTNAATNTNLFTYDTNQSIRAGSNLPIFWSGTNNTLFFPPGFPGVWRIVLMVGQNAGVAAWGVWGIAYAGGLSGVTNDVASTALVLTSSEQFPEAGISSKNTLHRAMFYATALGGTITYTQATAVTNIAVSISVDTVVAYN